MRKIIEESNLSVENLDEFKNHINSLKEEFPSQLVILLSGELGAGKTQFVKCLVDDSFEASSPTFAFHNEYQSQLGSIDHIDLYRLADDEDLESTGFWDFFEKPNGLIVIEWADRLSLDSIPLNWPILSVEILKKPNDENHRIIKTKRYY